MLFIDWLFNIITGWQELFIIIKREQESIIFNITVFITIDNSRDILIHSVVRSPGSLAARLTTDLVTDNVTCHVSNNAIYAAKYGAHVTHSFARHVTHSFASYVTHSLARYDQSKYYLSFPTIIKISNNQIAHYYTHILTISINFLRWISRGNKFIVTVFDTHFSDDLFWRLNLNSRLNLIARYKNKIIVVKMLRTLIKRLYRMDQLQIK